MLVVKVTNSKVAEKVEKEIVTDVPRKAEVVLDMLAKRALVSVGAEARHNLGGGMWRGGPEAQRRFHSRIGKGPKRAHVSISANIERTVHFWTTDPVSAIMERGSKKTWIIRPRGVTRGWTQRRRFKGLRGRVSLGARRALKISVGGEEIFRKEVVRRGQPRKPWLSQPIERFMNGIDGEVRKAINHARH